MEISLTYILIISITGLIALWLAYVCIRSLMHILTYGKNPIKVGVLHSLTGHMAISENPVADATLMAIREINAQGGLLGRKIRPYLLDGASDSSTFAKMAEKLIKKYKVDVVFGCWTSESRKTIKPIFEKHNHLLIYPLQHEGLEESPVIVYTGSTPNQQITPTIKWASDNLGKRFFLVGSDYVFPHTANEIIKDQISAMGDKVVGESYIPLGSKDVESVVTKIKEANPEVIINTINGETNIHFFKALRKHGITSDKTPTISFSIAENELLSMDASHFKGDYAAWSYFQNIPSERNRQFIESYKKMFGQNRVTDDPIEAGYFGVYLWAGAVNTAQTSDVNKVRKAMKGQQYHAPQGNVYIDSKTHHTWKELRIGQIDDSGQFNIVWSSNSPLPPNPYPVYRSKAEWDNYLFKLYKGWGDRWSNLNH